MLEETAAAYRAGADRPLGPFVGLMGVYGTLAAAGAALVWRKGAPEGVRWGDLVLITIATHKLSRLLAKDPVTSPLRAPFARFEGQEGPAELKEEVRGTGVQKAVGELVTCPFCLAQWVATAFLLGLALAPRATRMAAAVFTAVTGADVLQLAYAALEEKTGS